MGRASLFAVLVALMGALVQPASAVSFPAGGHAIVAVFGKQVTSGCGGTRVLAEGLTTASVDGKGITNPMGVVELILQDPKVCTEPSGILLEDPQPVTDKASIQCGGPLLSMSEKHSILSASGPMTCTYFTFPGAKQIAQQRYTFTATFDLLEAQTKGAGVVNIT